MVLGRKVLSDLQRLFFFSLMGVGVLIDLVRMREDRNKAFIFLLLSLLLGGFSGGVGAIQYQVFYFENNMYKTYVQIERKIPV